MTKRLVSINSGPFFRDAEGVWLSLHEWKYLAEWIALVRQIHLHHELPRPGTRESDYFAEGLDVLGDHHPQFPIEGGIHQEIVVAMDRGHVQAVAHRLAQSVEERLQARVP